MSVDASPLAERLSVLLAGTGNTVDSSSLTRALYSSDSSIYRIAPVAVVVPRSREDVVAAVRAARELGVPITARGAGTSCAGNAVGEGIVLDVSKHLTRIHSIDPEARTAVIDPGVVQEQLQVAARPHGLRLGPDPSTSSRCTVGGMIGNNACGPRALGYGRMADNVVELEIVDGRGEVLVLGRDEVPGLSELVDAHLGTIRTEFGHFSRQVSGYSLEHLLPEKGRDVAKFFAGTEGTLGIITRATVQLAPDPAHRVMVALGYPSMPDAGDDIANLLRFRPTACEGLDRRIVDVVVRQRGAEAVPSLPRGEGWMFIELAGDDAADVRSRADALLAAAAATDGWVVEDQTDATALWQLRADGAGLAGVSLERPAYAGWEDAAVPPQKLGDYLRDFDALLDKHGLQGLPYGHFGDGCVHCRIDFPLEEPGGPQAYRAFVVEAAKLVASHGGSMSGEHGDGRARSELLQHMYSPAALELFGAVKQLFDPDNILNPGVLVDPAPVEADLRMTAVSVSPLNTTHPEFVREVHQCTGVGKCVSASLAGGSVMCPSFQATREEKDSTRGRARVLQEMVNGSVVAGGWRSPEVHEALDLCLSCKGCARDCPTGIDMAAYKSRVIHESYKGRLRPRSHYALGWLPRWGRLISALRVGPLVNLVGSAPLLNRVLKWGAGVDGRREIPRFAGRRARQQLDSLTEVLGSAQPRVGVASGGDAETQGVPVDDHRPGQLPHGLDAEPATPADASAVPQAGPKGEVLVWVDSFSDCFESRTFAAVVQVLVRLGYEPRVLEQTACCGLTWITTGQLDGARREIERAARVLHPFVEQGTPIVGLEPSCTAVWRGDAQDLAPGNTQVAELRDKVLTLAEFLTADPDFAPPDLSGHTIVAQPHCHHASVIGWQADADLLAATGADVVRVPGCCGLAGNFGVERGHHEVSVKVFEQHLLPAVTDAPDDAILLADGFSCQTQLRSLAHRDSMSLAELLATH